MKMWTLKTFYFNNTFTDITKIVIWKISTHIEKKSTFKIIYNQSLRAVQKELPLKLGTILEKYLFIIPFLDLDFPQLLNVI